MPQLAAAGADDVVHARQPEGHEQEPRLVHVPVVSVDDDEPELVLGEAPAQTVRKQRPTGAAAEYHHLPGHARHLLLS